MGKVLIFSAPSGSGKTTIVRHLLERFPELEFSISATSRAPRGAERDGVDYYFLDDAEFRARVEQGEFVEWEEVYAGTCYGTLRAEIDRIWDREHVVVFDVDVVGALNIKKLFGDQALSIFIMPPSVEVLRARLEGRGTDSPEAIERRLAKAEQEIAYASKFDRVIVNDDLETAYAEARRVVGDFLAGR
ncbi:guanylate kinase [uncultured Rikenella sp.]|uniref:guanylate kinase n=1 Tax=uncultured Rikenella sp. TaxID=368003 RepID=UPI0025F08139|nr:guanylate kinase [uncultured Rikenella sp.]